MFSSEAARAGVAPQEIQTLISNLRIRPVITAHPTESKRVTVLEKYRKIYLLLRELENCRAGPSASARRSSTICVTRSSWSG